jgi:uncharacterized protein (DUF58 family)
MNWFITAILFLLVSLAFGLSLPAYAMYVLLGIMLTSRWLARHWIESLSAERECNRYVANVGNMVAVVVVVRNSSRLPVAWTLIEDLLPRRAITYQPPSLQVVGRRMQLALVQGGGRYTMTYQLRCNRRGYHQIGPVIVETGDLFGLHRRYRVLTSPHFLLVYPDVVPLEGYEIASRRPIGEIHLSHRLYEDPTRIAGVRRYELGDPLNRIHWRATARTGQLHCKLCEPSCIAGATLLLDFHKGAFEPSNEPYRSELAVTAAASLANAVYEMDQQIGLVTNGRDAADRIRQEGWDYDIRSRKAARRAASMADDSDRLQPVTVETRRGPEQLDRILQTLARVELTDGLNFAQLVSEVASRLPRDATVIAILTSIGYETAVALGELRHKGLAVTAILNVYDDTQFAEASGLLEAEGIDARHLKSVEALPTLCRQYVLR